MKALSIRQPWAWAIMSGQKTIENRTWRTTYRGALLIHAGRTFDRDGLDHLRDVPELLQLGALLGTVRLVDCLPIRDAPKIDHAHGPWCWILESPHAFAAPILYRGQLGLFDVDLAIERSAQIANSHRHRRHRPGDLQ